MKSRITSKFQVTIPREIRALLKLRVSDSIADFGDAVIAAAAKTLEVPVYTFDRVFRRRLERI